MKTIKMTSATALSIDDDGATVSWAQNDQNSIGDATADYLLGLVAYDTLTNVDADGAGISTLVEFVEI